jgi:class 3 adenylate cyclase
MASLPFSIVPLRPFDAASSSNRTRIEYRVGVNLGDVIVESDDIYGDGVNIATRIEGIAEPGQVFISGAIYEQIKHKVVCSYEVAWGASIACCQTPTPSAGPEVGARTS